MLAVPPEAQGTSGTAATSLRCAVALDSSGRLWALKYFKPLVKGVVCQRLIDAHAASRW